MSSILDRSTFVGELMLYTYRNLFPNNVPVASGLFVNINMLFLANKLKPLRYDQKDFFIKEMDLSEPGYVKILFWLIDPSIPDPDYADQASGTKRTAKRGVNEEPVRSAHVLIDVNSTHQARSCYPMAIEDVDRLPRSLVTLYLNKVFEDHFRTTKKRTVQKDIKTYKPACKFLAPYSHTLAGVMDNGGVLREVKVIQEGVVSPTFGDANYPVFENNDLQMKVKNRPSGKQAKQILRQMWNGQNTKYLKKMKVTIDDEFSNPKTLTIDLRKADILSNFFLKKSQMTGFALPLNLSEDAIRGDVIDKMKAVLA